MENARVPTPFGPAVNEIPLFKPPLALVVAQIRFPPIASIANESFIGRFQEAIRERYPILRREQETALMVTPEGILPAGAPGTLWYFSSTDGAWRISLASSFVALQATEYTSRSDFFERLDQAVLAVEDCFKPAVVDRLGVRYVDRFEDTVPQRVAKLVRSELYGIIDSDLGVKRVQLRHSITDTIYSMGGPLLHARWGWLPKGMMVDPTMAPAKTDSWLLDLDMYVEETKPFDSAKLGAQARQFAEQIYRFFRWAVTDTMLEQYVAKSSGGASA